MIRVRQVEVYFENDNLEEIKKQTAIKLNIHSNKIKTIKINKKSLDARKKPKLKFIYEVDIETDEDYKILKHHKKDVIETPDEKYQLQITGTKKLEHQIVIVGSGPAGLFSAYILAQNGYKPIIIERGEKVEDRIKSVEEFWKTGKLNKNSNVQFGEGGAGTFSDGKLNTLTKDPNHRMKKVFEIFVECGANPDIMYDYKPHIGTDVLRTVVQNMRNKIIEMGGEFYFETCLTDIHTKENCLYEIEVNHNRTVLCENLILAIGHSARDTFQMLLDHKLRMSPKPFAVGIRIQHLQSMINESQYGMKSHPLLPPASYKLTYQTKSGRGVYSFCMCPGGYVVNASSEEGLLAINGMSNYQRESENANSAIVVSVKPEDYGNGVLDGLNFQRTLEQLAYQEGDGLIPIQTYQDFKENKMSTSLKNVKPIFKGNYKLVNVNRIFPKYISDSLIEGIEYFGTKIKGYNSSDAIIAGVESRTSSPVRIERNENLESNIKGIYPCGEGSGYAGGITTAAMDGMKIAEMIISNYQSLDGRK